MYKLFSKVNMPDIPEYPISVGTYLFNNINNFQGEAVTKWANSNSQYSLCSLNSTEDVTIDIVYEISIYKGNFKFIGSNNEVQSSIIEEDAADGTYGKIYDYGKVTLKLPKGKNELLFVCDNADLDIRLLISCDSSVTNNITTIVSKEEDNQSLDYSKNDNYKYTSILEQIDNKDIKEINITSKVNNKLIIQDGNDYEVKVGSELAKHAKSEFRNGVLTYYDDYGTNLSFPNWRDEDYNIIITLPLSKNEYNKVNISAQSGELNLKKLTSVEEIKMYIGGQAKIGELNSYSINIESYASYIEINKFNSLSKTNLSSHTGTIIINNLYAKDCEIKSDGTSLVVNNGAITKRTSISNLYTPIFLSCDFKGEITLENEADLELNIPSDISDYKIVFNNIGNAYINDKNYSSDYNSGVNEVNIKNTSSDSHTRINFR